MKIGEIIKKRRQEVGLTLEQVGNACGAAKSTILKYENGKINTPTADMIVPLAKVLKCSELYLLGIVDDPSPLKIKRREEDWWDKEVGTKIFNNEDQKELADFANYLIIKNKIEEWKEQVGTTEFSEEEQKELINFAKYLISKR